MIGQSSVRLTRRCGAASKSPATSHAPRSIWASAVGQAWGGGCCKGTFVIFRKALNGAGSISLPATTTGSTVAATTVVAGNLPAISVSGIKVTQQMVMHPGVKVWHDRSAYTWTKVPAYLNGADFVQQPHKSIPKNSRITVKTDKAVTLYVASEPGGRSCGFERLTKLMGFTKMPEKLSWGGGCCKGDMAIYAKKINPGSTTLPPTSTNQCVGSIFFKTP